MSGVQIGWIMPSGATPADRRSTYVDDVERGLQLIKGRLDSVWMEDHLQIEGSKDMWNPEQADLLEGWTALTFFAARHSGLRFGHAVLCQSYRNPALLAKMAATLQYLTNGMYLVGLGAGWHAAEYKAYGYDFPSGRLRVEQLGDTLNILSALWRREPATYTGNHYSIEDAYCSVHPANAPQIMVGGTKPRVIRLAARYADWWDVYEPTISEYRNLVSEMERACVEVGRDPSTLRRSCWFEICACAQTELEAEKLAGTISPMRARFMGKPEQVVEQMLPYIELGVDRFEIGCSGFPNLTSLEMIIDEVVPILANLSRHQKS